MSSEIIVKEVEEVIEQDLNVEESEDTKKKYKPEPEDTEWIEKAYHLKRSKGVSWTKMPQALFEQVGVYLPVHQIRDRIRDYEAKNGLAATKPQISLVMNLSDVHIGKKTKSTNLKKLEERLTYYFEETISQVKLLKKSHIINEIHINFIGDIMDNDSLYPTQPHHVDHEDAGYAGKQIKQGIRIFKALILKLKEETKVAIVKINAVRGNHGRVNKFTHESNNFDVMFYDGLETAMTDVKGVKFNISYDFYAIATVENHNFLLHHGHSVKMYQNIPWYGLVQRCMRWAGSLSESFDYMIVGHFHTSGEQVWNDKIIFMNGTAVTDDDFGVEVIGLSASNDYWTFTVNKDKGIMGRTKVNLGDM